MAVVPRIGTEFAGYRIEALLGRGGMSVVYRAENARLGNKVALKLLAEGLADDESFRERFVRESRTAATLNHPNIVTIYDAGDWEGVLYIAMRWVDGDLKDHLKRTGPLAPDHALAIAAQIGSALDAAHARGLLHRDVKPANILLEPGEPGSEPIAYLADFGLTKHLESRSGITASGQFVGTIDYMSPEQIEGRDVDARTDIYSLGCVVFESLAGGTPFRRETEVAVLWAHMRDDPPPLTEARPELLNQVDDVIRKAMAKSPDERYGSCRDFAADLRRALGVAAAETYADRTIRETDRPALAPTAAQRPRRRARPRRLLPALAILGALVLAGVLGALVYELVRDVTPQVIAPTGTTFTADEQLLANRIPIPSRFCRKSEPPTPDFSAAFVCRRHDPRVIEAHYYKPKSARRMVPYFEKRAFAEMPSDLIPGARLEPVRHCGAPPALQDWRRRGETGHRFVRPGEDPNGRFLCYRQRGSGWASIEWTDADADVYSAAFGRDLIKLRQWWEREAGPLPPD
jgi:serine/threonine-protein kinase